MAAITARRPWTAAQRPAARPSRAIISFPAPPGDGDSWKAQAACHRDPDPDAWFPEAGHDMTRTERAVRTCQGCPVRAECLRAAISRREPGGIWGGLTTRQRNKLIKNKLIKAASRPAPRAPGPIDTARRLAALRAHHGTLAATARAAHMSRSTVSMYLDLLDLDDSTQERVQAGILAVTTAAGAVRAARARQRTARRAS
jgi:WhiB family transcriptional regulator, redox-sensing transcriptional regulator